MALKEMPKVGDKVRYVGEVQHGISYGDIFEVFEIPGEIVIRDNNGLTRSIRKDRLWAWELVDGTPSATDLIANLARRVSELEACLAIEQAHRADLTAQNAQQAYEINELYKAVARL